MPAAENDLASAAARLRDLATRLPLVCRTFYRSDVEREAPVAGPVLVLLPEEHAEATAVFPHLSLMLTHGADGYEGRALHVEVVNGSGKLLLRLLYQLGYAQDPSSVFGSHGFTGLVYANDPATGAELQFFVHAQHAPTERPPSR